MVEEAFSDKIMEHRWLWIIINNLELFNDQPSYILELMEKLKTLRDHPVLSSFDNVFEVIEKYYNSHSKFPNVKWLKVQFKDIRSIYVYPDPFTMQIYESIMKYIDRQIVRQEVLDKFINVQNPTTEDIAALGVSFQKLGEKEVPIEESTKESIINGYENYNKVFDGIKTWIKPLDDVIGVLGFRSLSVFAAPSGHGKSTFAFSVALYAALHGNFVEYLSFEVPKEHAWFNFVSAFSADKNKKLEASRIKCCQLTEEEAELYKVYSEELLDAIGRAGGMIHIIDQTSTSGSVNTFEDLCGYLENIADKRGRKADLIIVDNIDNFQVLRSTNAREDDSTRINNYIIRLDGFVKRYHHGAGTAMLLLSQVNRVGMKKLHSVADSSKASETKIDVTCIQKYNALYEKPTCILIGYADEATRSMGALRVHVAKLRNMPSPTHPLTLTVSYAYSRVLGDSGTNTNYSSQKDYNKNAVRTLRGPSGGTGSFDEDLQDD